MTRWIAPLVVCLLLAGAGVVYLSSACSPLATIAEHTLLGSNSGVCSLWPSVTSWFWKHQAHASEQEAVVAKREVQQQAVTAQVVDHYITRIQVVHDAGATIIKQVPVYVPSDACPLPGGFRLLFDAAATGVPVPDAAIVADAAPASAQDVAGATAENFGIANENAEQLKALQEWVRRQQAAAQ